MNNILHPDNIWKSEFCTVTRCLAASQHVFLECSSCELSGVWLLLNMPLKSVLRRWWPSSFLSSFRLVGVRSSDMQSSALSSMLPSLPLEITGKEVGWLWKELLVASDVSDSTIDADLCGWLIIERVLAGDWSEWKLVEAALVSRASRFPATSTCFAALLIRTLGILVTIWNAWAKIQERC